MIYLDNAATSFPKPAEVADAMSRFMNEAAANPGRAGHRMAVAAEQMLDDVRLRLTRLVDGEDPSRLIFAMNCTDALNMAIKGVLGGMIEGPAVPHVVSTVLEHNSVSRPLEALSRDGLIELERVACDAEGFVDPDRVAEAMTDRTALVIMTHASNVLGTIQDVAAVGERVRARGALFCVDAAQTAGVLPISVRRMQIDLLAFPGHKSLYGPTGTGGLYVGERCPEPAEAMAATHEAGHLERQVERPGRLRPWREGGTGGDSSTPTQPTLYPYYLEGGTPNTVGIAGLRAALVWGEQHAMEQVLAHERSMLGRIAEALGDGGPWTIHGPDDMSRRVGALSFSVEGLDPSDVGSILDDSFEIAVRPGLHCAPYTHRHLGTFPDGTVRVSPGPFTTEEEIDRLIDALGEIVL